MWNRSVTGGSFFLIDTIIKFLHILASTFFLGNIVATLLWKVMADHSEDQKVINHVLRTARRLDSAVTVPASAAVTITGCWLALGYWRAGNSPLWLNFSLLIWITSAIIALVALVPLLKRLEVLSNDPLSFGSHYFTKLSKRWTLLAAALILLPVAVLALMVAKPVL
jgi:uncharacterized membrane protein